MAVGLMTRIQLTIQTREVLLHVLQTHNSQNPIFLDLASRLTMNPSLLQEITEEEIHALLSDFRRRGNGCLPPEAEELLMVLRQAANDFQRLFSWH